jgi:hypothetical protein
MWRSATMPRAFNVTTRMTGGCRQCDFREWWGWLLQHEQPITWFFSELCRAGKTNGLVAAEMPGRAFI